MDLQEAVILVVGSNTEHKARVAEALAKGRGASNVETTKSRVRIFRRESSPEAVVVDTVTIPGMDGCWLIDRGRVWVSINSLRELCGKYVYVVCVLSSSGPDDSIHQEADLWNEKFTFLNELGYIFQGHQQAIMLLVKLDGEDKSEAKKSAIRDVLVRDGFARSSISFESFERLDLLPTVKLALEKSVYKSIRLGNSKASNDTLKPFLLKEVESNAKDVDMYGPWGPERVILFGRTGSGKSSLAQMLTMGKLDPLSTKFASSSSIRGETKKMQCGQGTGWYVVDTPGFGEPKDELSTVSTEEAEKKVKNYVQMIEGNYSHFLYVVAKDRIDRLEMNLWEFFSQLFGEDNKESFTVVISNATPIWVEENKDHLKKSFTGCQSFLSGEFPPTKTDDKEWEEELQEVRVASLKQLEEELGSLKRPFCVCDYGLFSKGLVKERVASLRRTSRELRSTLYRTCVVVGTGIAVTNVNFRRLMLTLSRDDKVVLLPL